MNLIERLRIHLKDYGAAVEAADRIKQLEAAMLSVERKLLALNAQWAQYGGPFDGDWISDVVAALDQSSPPDK
jgi:hypothetical protein